MVANDARAPGWCPRCRVVRDATPGLGPLAGLVTALDVAEGAGVLALAWDMPFVTAPLLSALRAAGEARGRSVAPAHGDAPVVEPLCAYYRPEAADVARALLARGVRRAGALHERLAAEGLATTLGEDDLRAHGEPAHLFTSVDTREKLEQLGGRIPDGDMGGPPRR